MRVPLVDMLHFSIIVGFLKQFTYISRRKLLCKDHSVMDVNGTLWNIIQVKIIHKHIVKFMVYINLRVTREIIHVRLYDAVKDDTCSYVWICVKTNTIGCRYNAVQHDIILHTSLQWLVQNTNKSLNSQKTPHS